MSMAPKQRGGYVGAFLCCKIRAISLKEKNGVNMRPFREGTESRDSRVGALTCSLRAENTYSIFERKIGYFEI